MLSGKMDHEDSMGNKGTIGPGEFLLGQGSLGFCASHEFHRSVNWFW